MTIKTIKFKKINSIKPEQEREVKGIIIALALFASGMIIGAGILKNTSSDISNFIQLFDEYIYMRTQQKIYQLLFNSILVNISCVIIANFAGMSCIGIPFAVLLVVTKGLGSGFLAGYLFSEFAMSGIGYYLLTILPGAIIANSALLIACNSACFMSADILATILSKKQADENLIKTYIKKNLIILIISFVASVFDCVLTKAFSYLFVF